MQEVIYRRALFLMIALLFFLPLSGCGKGKVTHLVATGTIEATEYDLSAKVTGKVLTIPEEGTKVKKNDFCIILENKEIEANLRAAEAALVAAERRLPQTVNRSVYTEQQTTSSIDAAKAVTDSSLSRYEQAQTAYELQIQQTDSQIRQARAFYESSKAALLQAESQLVKTTNDYKRAKELYNQGFIAAQSLDAARTAYESSVAQKKSASENVKQAKAAYDLAIAAKAQIKIKQKELMAAKGALDQASANLSGAQSGKIQVTVSQQEIDVAKAQLKQAKASRDYAAEQVRDLRASSPVNGWVTRKMFEIGELVPAGTFIITVADLDQVWIYVYIPEKELGYVKINEKAEITVDTFPGEIFTGTVAYISPEAEFTPKNIQTKEDRVTLTFKVKILVQNKEQKLKPGMPADVKIFVQ